MRRLLAIAGIAAIVAITSPVYALTISPSSNTPGTADLAEVTTMASNFSGTTTINVSVTDFTQPVAGTLTSMLTGSLTTTDPAGDSITFLSCAFDTNVHTTNCGGATATTAMLTLPLTTTSTSVTDFVNVGLTSPYSLVQVIVVMLVPGDDAELTAVTEVIPAPEPMSAALLASGLFAVGWLRRRRKIA